MVVMTHLKEMTQLSWSSNEISSPIFGGMDTMVFSVGSNFRNRKYIVLHLNPYTVVVAIGGKILLPQCDQ